jgi:hypothetical protein
VAAAVAALLAGCSSGSGSPAAGGTPHSATAPSATAGGAATEPPATTGTAAAEAPGSAADAPRVPDAQLTPPGGGTFTARQKQYLSGRVPRGTDPVAVLEGGQEVCERLARTSAVDPDAAASAIVTGDISLDGASAAVAGLCPDQQGVVDAARGGFGDGTFTVAARAVPGSTVAPGGYRAVGPSPSCAWQVTGADGAVLASGRAPRLTVPAAARGITSSGCHAWLGPARTGS